MKYSECVEREEKIVRREIHKICTQQQFCPFEPGVSEKKFISNQKNIQCSESERVRLRVNEYYYYYNIYIIHIFNNTKI